MGDVVPLGRKFISPVQRLVERSKPDFKRGLIIGFPNDYFNSPSISEKDLVSREELRRFILFWDHLAWPTNNSLMMTGGKDIQYLEELGFLSRPHYSDIFGEQSQIFSTCYHQCFNQLEAKNPGAWAIAQAPGAQDGKGGLFECSRGAQVDLVRAVPVPSAEMPMEEVLEFRLKRIDEVNDFHIAVGDFFENWINSEDQAHQLRLAQNKIQRACADLISVSRETRYPFRISNWKVGYAFPLIVGMPTYLSLEAIPKLEMFPFAEELLGIGAGYMTINKALAKKKEGLRTSPYRYSVSMEKELLGPSLS